MNGSQTNKELSVEEITQQLTQYVQSQNLPEFYKLVKELRPYDLSLIYKNSLKTKRIVFFFYLNRIHLPIWPKT